MLRIDKNENKLVRLTESALAKADHWERQLQAMICAAPDAFCKEIGEPLSVIGQEVRPSDAVSDRIDILAVDEDGSAVVIELKRGSNKLQLLQAVSYAGMISRWTPDKFVETLALNYKQSNDDARAVIEDLAGDISSINNKQRILLIAEDFDPALLFAAEWLHDYYSVDIRCYRLQLSQENANDYLTCTCTYPPIEIANLTRGEIGRREGDIVWASWDVALESIENVALKDFVRAELDKHQESRLSKRQIIYRISGKRRFYLSCTGKYAYVWQVGRFEGDCTYWQKRLSEPDHVLPVKNKQSLRFHLTTAADFAAFANAINQELTKVEFSEMADLDQPTEE
jgi:hypothetical protein